MANAGNEIEEHYHVQHAYTTQSDLSYFKKNKYYTVSHETTPLIIHSFDYWIDNYNIAFSLIDSEIFLVFIMPLYYEKLEKMFLKVVVFALE